MTIVEGKLRTGSEDISGHKFGKLTATKFIGWVYQKRGREEVWEFKCDCGNTTQAFKKNVLRGFTKSCRCVQQEARGKSSITHGDSRGKRSALYLRWKGMVQRCTDPNHKSYYLYGGMGIKVEWASYEAFKMDMGESFDPKLSIERIDNDGNYSKANCKWATYKEQVANRRPYGTA